MYKIRRVYLVTTKGDDGHENFVINSTSNGSFVMKRSESDYFGRGGGVFFHLCPYDDANCDAWIDFSMDTF